MGGLSYSEIPRKSTVTVTPDFLCTVVYGAISAATYNIVQYSSNQLCAGSLFGGSGVCRGDAGGPLLTDSVPPKMIGITSWGLEGVAMPILQSMAGAAGGMPGGGMPGGPMPDMGGMPGGAPPADDPAGGPTIEEID